VAKQYMNSKNSAPSNFDNILSIIQTAKERIVKTVNTEIIDLYWQIGKEVSDKTKNNGWGKSVVEELANHISSHLGAMRGFSAQNIWRMKQFYETYHNKPILSTLLRELSWSNNLLIMSRAKDDNEKMFYMKLAIDEKYSYRELDRQITSMRYERSSIGASRTKNLPVRSVINDQFLDSYVLDFLHLPEKHPEETLQKAIIANMKSFLLEIGKDFTFVGEEFRVQVGKTDFYIDLLFYHRGLSCLVAFELKTTSFKPEYIGKMNFYLEVLDRNHKKENENPSVGVILCADKDDEVVEYALQRNLSPVLVAEYTAKLPNKTLLQNKLRELTNLIM
jgi:predicted nuclease of restriction endonuclease-like (RecB) superfamily